MPGGKRSPEADQRAVRNRAEKRQSEHDITDRVFQYGRYKSGAPKPKNPKRRNECRRDFRQFICTYLVPLFSRPFSQHHDIVIHKIEKSVLEGSQFCEAMPRGSGKTTLAEAAILWALLYGHTQFPVILGAKIDSAVEILDSIIGELEENEKLLEDFPETAIPFEALDGKSARCRYQICDGERTQINMKTGRLECPRITGSPCAGSIIATMGLQGHVRGPRKRMPDGTIHRPDFVFLDDPQTDESAASNTQTQTRENLISGAVLGMAGPGQKIAALAAVTVIYHNDLADRLLNHEQHPEWQGERMSMILSWPERSDLWQEYTKLRRDGMGEGDEGAQAREFYRANKEKMDKGGVVSWEARLNDDDISALQHAYDLYIDRGEEIFYSEYQNQPKSQATKAYELSAERVAKNVNGHKARVAPAGTQFVTGMADVNHYGLHWVILGVQQDMTGAVLEYGRYPASGKLVEKNATESEIAKAVYEGCYTLLKTMVDFHIEGVDQQRIGTFLIDCGYQMETVFRICNQIKAPFVVLPSRGRPEKSYRQNKVIGQPRNKCHLTRYESKGRVLEHSADYWRMATQKGFLQSPLAPGSLSLYGNDPQQHKEFARHIVAEYLIEHISGDIADYYNWAHMPGEIWDWLDALVGAWAASNYLGASFGGVVPKKRKKKRRKPKVPREEL